MSDRSVPISAPSSAPGKATSPPAAAARTKLLLEGPIMPTLLRLAAPNVLTLLAFAGVITFDGFFLGRIGTNALAGASLAFPWVMMVLQTTNSGMGVGVSSAVARALGAGRRDRADALVFHAFLLALASPRSSPPCSCWARPSCSGGWADGTKCWRTRSPTRTWRWAVPSSSA